MIVDKSKSAEDLHSWMIQDYGFAWLDVMEATAYARLRLFAFGDRVEQLWPPQQRLGFESSTDANMTTEQMKRFVNESFWAASVGTTSSYPMAALADCERAFLYNRTSSSALMRLLSFYDNVGAGQINPISMLDGRIAALGAERKLLTRCAQDPVSVGVNIAVLAGWATNGSFGDDGVHGGLFDRLCYRPFEGDFPFEEKTWHNHSHGLELVRDWWGSFSCPARP
jgi:hypothetical protein